MAYHVLTDATLESLKARLPGDVSVWLEAQTATVFGDLVWTEDEVADIVDAQMAAYGVTDPDTVAEIVDEVQGKMNTAVVKRVTNQALSESLLTVIGGVLGRRRRASEPCQD